MVRIEWRPARSDTSRFARGVVAAILLALLCGCAASPAPRPTPSTTSWLPAGATIEHDVSYGTDPNQRLDVYRPHGAVHDPILVMVHGGGWTRGDKAAASVVHAKVAHYLPAGCVFVSIDYRLAPQADPIEQAGDVASALAYVQAHATGWGGDARRVVLMGHSAGANLVSLVTADPSYAKNAGAAPWLGTVSLDSAAYDVPQIMQQPHLPLYDRVFGNDQRLWRAASPTLVVAGTPPPMLLVCATGRAGSCPQAHDFAAALTAHGVRASVVPSTLRHGEIDSELGTPGALTDSVDRFLRALGVPT